jgi:hypothetical protein
MAETRRVYVGTLPNTDVLFVSSEDPVPAMLAAAGAALDRARADDERLQRQALADAERAKKAAQGMRLARTMRRFKRALKMRFERASSAANDGD